MLAGIVLLIGSHNYTQLVNYARRRLTRHMWKSDEEEQERRKGNCK